MITIVTAALGHVPGIHAIEIASFSDPWSAEAISTEIYRTEAVCFVAVEKDIVIGYVSMRHIIDEGHISNIAVAENFRQKGVGSLLLGALVQEAEKRKLVGVTLEVRVSNHAALHLYKKYGFTIEGYRKNYYTQPTEDAAIMWLKFKNIEVDT